MTTEPTDRLIEAINQLVVRIDSTNARLDSLPPWETVIVTERRHRRIGSGILAGVILVVAVLGFHSEQARKEDARHARCAIRAAVVSVLVAGEIPEVTRDRIVAHLDRDIHTANCPAG